jgi:predicted XRE-type DNA-binding protein
MLRVKEYLIEHIIHEYATTPANQKEIAARHGLPKSTISRILNEHLDDETFAKLKHDKSSAYFKVVRARKQNAAGKRERVELG